MITLVTGVILLSGVPFLPRNYRLTVGVEFYNPLKGRLTED